MRLIIVRHAEPDYSIDSLTKKGWREAEFLSERLSKLNVTACYCSPLGRAKDTARATLEKLNMETEILDWLQEFGGKIKGQNGEDTISWDLLPQYWTGFDKIYSKDTWFDAEPYKNTNNEAEYKRVCEGIDALLSKHGYTFDGKTYRVEKENRDTIILFCHFGVEMVILSHILHISPAVLWHSFVALPSSVTTLITEERKQGIANFRCCGFGDTSHLYKKDEPLSFAARFCENYSAKDERH